MIRQIDARGSASPRPVMDTQKALDAMEQGEIITLVDDPEARDHLIKLAEALRCEVKVEQHGEAYQIFIKKRSISDLSVGMGRESSGQAIFVTGNTLGRGSDELGNILMESFFYSLIQNYQIPRLIALVNSGVLLVCEGSPVLEHLRELERNGTEVLVSGACLDYYQQKYKLRTGKIANMYVILEKLSLAEKTLTI